MCLIHPGPHEYPGPLSAIGFGYGESKWAAERIFDTLLPSVSLVRIGQLGGGPGEDWSLTDWFPSLVLSGPHIKCLPDIGEDAVSGKCFSDLFLSLADPLAQRLPILPLKVGAKAVIQLAFDRNSARIAVVDHPNALDFTQSMYHAKSALKCPDIEIVPIQSWIERLKDYTQTGRKPALNASKLLGFFEYTMGEVTKAHKLRGEVASAVPRNTPVISQEDINNWVSVWTQPSARL